MRYLLGLLVIVLLGGCAMNASMLACQRPLVTDPAAPASGMLLYCKQYKGKTSLNVMFPSGSMQQLVVEP